MSDASKETDRNTCRNIRSIEFRCLTNTGGPHENTPDHTDNELSAGDEPMRVDHVGGLLVVHIVECVTGVPCHDQADLKKGGEDRGDRENMVDARELLRTHLTPK